MSFPTPRASHPSLPRATRSISPGGRPERLAELPDCPTRSVRRERRHERRAVVAIALVDARYQDLPDVAREVEVDVRKRGQLVVEESPDQQLVGDRVDVRESGQVADDRGDARAATAARRQQRPGSVRPADLDGHLAGQLEQVVVKEEEPRQVERLDDPQLFVQSSLGLAPRPDA